MPARNAELSSGGDAEHSRCARRRRPFAARFRRRGAPLSERAFSVGVDAFGWNHRRDYYDAPDADSSTGPPKSTGSDCAIDVPAGLHAERAWRMRHNCRPNPAGLLMRHGEPMRIRSRLPRRIGGSTAKPTAQSRVHRLDERDQVRALSHRGLDRMQGGVPGAPQHRWRPGRRILLFIRGFFVRVWRLRPRARVHDGRGDREEHRLRRSERNRVCKLPPTIGVSNE